MHQLRISTYIINLKSRVDRKIHILKEFSEREEFIPVLIAAYKHEKGNIGLWNSIRHIIQEVIDKEDEYVLICEDDHQFTRHYSKECLFNCIEDAKVNGADVLLGGIHWVQSSFPLSKYLFWAEGFTATQFTIIFKKFYKSILNADFGENDAADYKLSALTTNIFFIYPFISTQKEFGYSDATLKNNEEGRVTELFSKTSNTVQHLLNMAEFYRSLRITASIVEKEKLLYDGMVIPIYVVNLQERTERLEHILRQFEGRNEFDIKIVEACKHKIGAVGLWNSIRKIIRMAINNDDDVIIICEDDHEFTSNYSKEYLFRNIIGAHQQNVDILSGGIAGGFNHALPTSENRFWVDHFYCTQFIVVYRKLFERILNEPFDNTVIADDFLSELTNNKMTLYPFLSIQHAFGYSDVSPHFHADPNRLPVLFTKAAQRLEIVKTAFLKYNAGSQ